MKRLRRKIARIYDSADKPMLALWNWAKAPGQRFRRHRRWKALEDWATDRAHASTDPKKKAHWLRVAKEYHEHVVGTRPDDGSDLDWPATGSFSELLYHSPPHAHLASADRNFLIQIARIGQTKFNLRIGEFPPFDPVEDVHVTGSWHYRDSSAPHLPRSYAGRGDGLAFDGNDADGGADEEIAFYRECEARYG